MSDSFD